MVTVTFQFRPAGYRLSFTTYDTSAYEQIKQRFEKEFPNGRNKASPDCGRFKVSPYSLTWTESSSHESCIQVNFSICHNGYCKRFSDNTSFNVPGRTQEDVAVFLDNIAKASKAIKETDAKPEPDTQCKTASASEEWIESVNLGELSNSIKVTLFKEENVSIAGACKALKAFLSQADVIKKAFAEEFVATMKSIPKRSDKSEFYKELIGRGKIISEGGKKLNRPEKHMPFSYQGAATRTPCALNASPAAGQSVFETTTTTLLNNTLFSSTPQQSVATSRSAGSARSAANPILEETTEVISQPTTSSWSVISQPATSNNRPADTTESFSTRSLGGHN